jgi:peptidyl-prolyl cis-trans isomerase B (cyclophilin B)
VPNSKQRRDAAKRHLERQLAARQKREANRRRFTVLATAIGTIVILAVVIVVVVMVTNDDKNSPTASASDSAAASPSASASPTVSHTPLPSRAPAKIATRAIKKTTGPCGYTENATTLTAGNLFDVGLPADPKPTPTTTKTATFTTNLGVITVSLEGAGAPCNVQSIEYLISKKFYDNTACPRVVNSGIYVVQCGDPSGTTSGGPTYTTKDENLTKAVYSAGTLAMANSGANTNGSQFFFITKDSSSGLGKSYTVIGHVKTGLAILQKVAASGDDGSNSAGGGRPNTDLIFKTVTLS